MTKIDNSCFKESFKALMKLEFSSPKNALHINETEKSFTFMGIYQKAHPDFKGWTKIINTFNLYDKDIQKAGIRLYSDILLRQWVEEFYYQNFFKNHNLDKLKCKIAKEIFIFGVNAGVKTAIKKAQKIANIKADGIIGKVSINALNSLDDIEFDKTFDEAEIAYYEQLAQKKPSLRMYLKGWENRAVAV